MTATTLYPLRRPSQPRTIAVRGLGYHLECWGDASLATPERPLLVLLHGWMDVGASFQFVVDALVDREGPRRWIVAPDWRGFGRTPSHGDAYWFPDYVGDLDAIADALSPGAPIDLLGHSMGGNVAMAYAGVRPSRVQRLVNLEGFGLPATRADDAPKRLRQWLDELKSPAELRPYASVDDVAARLRKTNPRLPAEKAAWLARHWAAPDAQGAWRLLADPAHKRVNPVLYRADEAVAMWALIEAPLLWIEGAETDIEQWWQGRYPRAEFDARLARVARCERHVLAGSGHMLHHDQPEALADRLLAFLG